MTIPYDRLITAIKFRNMLELRRQFEGMELTELTEAGTFIGPERLRAMCDLQR